MVETERIAGASYLTCNERHHELILIEDRANRGYEHLALEVADASVLDGAAKRLTAAGGTLLGGVYDGEPGIDRALQVRSPGGHVYKLFCGMETTAPPPPGDRPVKFEHLSCKVANHRAEERFLTDGLGFRLCGPHGLPRLLVALRRRPPRHRPHPRAALRALALRLPVERLRRARPRRRPPQGRARAQVHLGPQPPRSRQQPLPLPPRRGRRDDRVLLGARPHEPTATSRATGRWRRARSTSGAARRPRASSSPASRSPRRSPAAPRGRCAPTARPQPPDP